ncbi:hypothetical protein ACWD3K_36220 [Streptomyces sp. NPDC002778]
MQADCDNALAQVKELTEQLSEVQDDLASAGIGLRRMICVEDAP